MTRSRYVLAVLALLVGTAPAVAQEAAPWRLSYFPYLTVTPNDGLMGIARMIWARQAGWGERIVNTNAVAIDAGYSTRDAWLGRLTWSNPTLADGWRLKTMADVGHVSRFGDPDGTLEHDRAVAWVDVTRRITGKVHLAVRGGVRNDRLGPNGTLDAPGSDVEGSDTDQTDVSVRTALVVDLRDREYEVNTGALLEAGMIAGTAGNADGYDAAYALARGYLHPILPLRLTGRVGWRQAIRSGGQLAPAIEFPAWEDPFPILGGHRTHRGFGTSQLRSDGVVLAGVEARLDIINVGELGAVTILAFLDGVKQLRHGTGSAPDGPTSGRTDWIVGAGGGLALRVMRAATLTITAAGGDGETRWYVGSGFSW